MTRFKKIMGDDKAKEDKIGEIFDN